MIDDYQTKFYNKLTARSLVLGENNYAKACEIAAWKEKFASQWDNIEIVSIDMPDKLIHNPQAGENYELNVIIDTKSLNDNGIGVELVVTGTGKDNKNELYDVDELILAGSNGGQLHFHLDYQLNRAGTFKYAFRMFPKNELLPHRQDFCYVRWF
jgi:starch phosphorylase